MDDGNHARRISATRTVVRREGRAIASARGPSIPGAKRSVETDEREGSRTGGDRPATEGSRTADDGKVTVIVGNESATISPPETLSFGVEVDVEDSLLGGPTGERGVVFSLSWSSEDVETDDELGIE